MCSCQFLAFGFLLQTLQNNYEKHKSIPSDQWPAWKATKTNPLRTCMTAGTCVLVTQALQRLPSWHNSFLRLRRINKMDDWHKHSFHKFYPHVLDVSFFLLFEIQMETSGLVKPSLKVMNSRGNPQGCNSQYAPLWNKAVYCTPMCHQTELAFPPAREEIPAFFSTLILRCSVEAKTRCVICTVQSRCSCE